MNVQDPTQLLIAATLYMNMDVGFFQCLITILSLRCPKRP